MTITEYAILVFKSPPDLSDPTLRSLFGKLSAWQSDCSGFPLRFYTNADGDGDASCEVYLVTGWTSVAAHEAWIRGERNQELLRVFGPYVDMPRVRMVHVGVDSEAIPTQRDEVCADNVTVIERYHGMQLGAGRTSFEKGWLEGCAWELSGRDLARDDGDVFRFAGVAGVDTVGEPLNVPPLERWVLKRVEL